jgi:hypothetical protein
MKRPYKRSFLIQMALKKPWRTSSSFRCAPDGRPIMPIFIVEIVEGEKTGDGTNSNKCTGPRKLQSHKRFLNIDARPMASFAFLPGALCFFI